MTERLQVIKHFEATRQYQGKQKSSWYDSVLLNFVSGTHGSCCRVLEVGGGRGHILNHVHSGVGLEELYNCELVPQAYRSQLDEHIRLLGGDAVNLPLRNDCFDYVIARNLLHHLVGRNRKESDYFYNRAIREKARVCKDKGYVVIIEETARLSLISSLIFYLTSFFSKLGFSLKPTEIAKGEPVVVSFVDLGELVRQIRSYGQIILNMEMIEESKTRKAFFMKLFKSFIIIFQVHKK